MSKTELILYLVVPALCLTSAEVLTLTSEDKTLLRELGAGDAMLDGLRRQARVAGQLLRLDFEAKAVIVENRHPAAQDHAIRSRVSVN